MLQRDTLRDQIKRVLLGRILEGKYKPGDRLLEMQVATELNASQGSVREALRDLEALRVVETSPYRGTRVRGVNAQEMREAYQVRAVLEDMAARSAARRLKGKTGPLEAELNAIRQAARTRNLEDYAKHNLRLHRLIIEASGNAVLLRVWESLDIEARARISLARPALDLRQAAESHQAIVEALGRGNGRLAGKLLREHAESCGRLVADLEPVAAKSASPEKILRPVASHG